MGKETPLDPLLPEKQRARQRLVGAIALVILGSVVLPLVLNSPPPPRQSVQITINNTATHLNGQAMQADANGPFDSLYSNSLHSNLNQPKKLEPIEPDKANENALAFDQAPNTTLKKNSSSLFENKKKVESGLAVLHALPNHKIQPNEIPNSDSVLTKQFILHLGRFDDEASAKAWQKRLNDHHFPIYIEPNGKYFLLRAGPFSNKNSAQTAATVLRQKITQQN